METSDGGEGTVDSEGTGEPMMLQGNIYLVTFFGY